MKPPFIRSPYNYDWKQASDETAYVETMPSLTVQSMTEDADLNVMMKRFGVTGQLPESPRVPQYADFSEISDYRSAMQAVLDADEKFMEYPPEVRARFDNDPQKLLEFVSVPGNAAEGVRLGLWKDVPVATSGSPSGVPAPAVEPVVPVSVPGASGSK